jgi:hypothetical protein
MVSETWSFNEKIYRTLFNNINNLRKNKILCDVILKVENQEFYAHRIILSACSDYFCAMFTNEVCVDTQIYTKIKFSKKKKRFFRCVKKIYKLSS